MSDPSDLHTKEDNVHRGFQLIIPLKEGRGVLPFSKSIINSLSVFAYGYICTTQLSIIMFASALLPGESTWLVIMLKERTLYLQMYHYFFTNIR